MRLNQSLRRGCLAMLAGAALLGPAAGEEATLKTEGPKPVVIPFHFVGNKSIVVPVKVGARSADFILDTGIGVNLISKTLAGQLNVKTTREYKGQRMSGQELVVPIGRISSLAVGSTSDAETEIGVWDLKGFFPPTPEFAGIQGFLSLAYFKSRPFTIDYSNSTIVIETPESLEKRKQDGKTAEIRVEQDQSTSVIAWISMSLPKPASQTGLTVQGNDPNWDARMGGGGMGRRGGGRGHRGGGTSTKAPKAWAEVDTGSDSLVVNSKYMSLFGVDPASADVRTTEGVDETGQPFRRFFATVSQTVSLTDQKEVSQAHPEVMFQKIEHDALVGESFLSQYVVTFDLGHSQMIFRKI